MKNQTTATCFYIILIGAALYAIQKSLIVSNYNQIMLNCSSTGKANNTNTTNMAPQNATNTATDPKCNNMNKIEMNILSSLLIGGAYAYREAKSQNPSKTTQVIILSLAAAPLVWQLLVNIQDMTTKDMAVTAMLTRANITLILWTHTVSKIIISCCKSGQKTEKDSKATEPLLSINTEDAAADAADVVEKETADVVEKETAGVAAKAAEAQLAAVDTSFSLNRGY